MSSRTIVLVLAVFVAALAGVLAGRSFVRRVPQPSAELHALLHHGLDLDATQKAQLGTLESRFGTVRKSLELRLRADNAGLAAAIQAEHGDGPQVRAAVDHTHQDMGELQKATLAHVFAMRQILRPDQAEKFDRAVVKALTADAR
jgi:nickel and cobalt resistance protein CnrR